MRMLLVDDDPPVLQVLRLILEPSGNELTLTTESRHASECLKEERFDALIFDVRMPPPDGFELTRQARSSSVNAKTPVVLLTGYDDAETMRQGFKAGASCFVGKPVTREKVRNLLRVLQGPFSLERRRQERLPFKTRVECLLGACGEKRCVAESRNLGEGGMLLEPSGGLTVGEAVQLEFQIPASRQKLRLRAKVRRRETPDRVAVEFDDGCLNDRETVQRYVLERLRM